MAWSPDESLVIAISSRALFNLDEEDRIYREQGTEAFIAYQQVHEDHVIAPGVAFSLVRSLLELNGKIGKEGSRPIEVVIVSKNHPDCLIRIRKSLEYYGIPIKRAFLTGGEPILPYLQALAIDLFLSKEATAVKEALAAGFSAGLIFGGPTQAAIDATRPVIAIDGDAVLFSDQSDKNYRDGGLEQFALFERENANVPLPPGPLHKFARALAELQTASPINEPAFRIALVTARDITYCERPIRTLRSWGLRLDQAFFVSDMSKRIVLAALKPLIFFDDSEKNCVEAAKTTPTVHVPPEPQAALGETRRGIRGHTATERKVRFLGICKLYLRKEFLPSEKSLLQWHEQNFISLQEDEADRIIDELERSVKGTPRGRQRRAASVENSNLNKLLSFLDGLVRKARRE